MKTDKTYQFILNVVYGIFLIGVIPAVLVCAFSVFLILLSAIIYVMPYVIFVGVSVWALKKFSE
jgi:hypothetical protein